VVETILCGATGITSNTELLHERLRRAQRVCQQCRCISLKRAIIDNWSQNCTNGSNVKTDQKMMDWITECLGINPKHDQIGQYKKAIRIHSIQRTTELRALDSK
jgi:hypothetical protein